MRLLEQLKKYLTPGKVTPFILHFRGVPTFGVCQLLNATINSVIKRDITDQLVFLAKSILV